MNTHRRASHPIYNLLPTEIEGFAVLAELALDLRSSWNHATDQVWRQLDPALWAFTHNPWVVLQTVSRDQIERVLADPAFRKHVDDLIQTRRDAAKAPAWFQHTYPQSPLSWVAYFSMEFMLSEALPIYSGGLGNVAGDQLKAASDLGVPVVGVSLLYQQGYFRQVIDKDGAQEALFPYNDPGQLPITPVRQANGEWLRLEIVLPGYSVWLRAWQVQVGQVKLYLLDSNDAANFPAHRGITSELYGGGPELRLKQELLLGIGGWRLLGALGIQPEVCHLNEGHAAFAVLERVRSFMHKTGQPFDVALVVRGQLADTLETGHDKAVIRTTNGHEEEHLVRPVARSKVASIPVGVDAVFLIDALDTIVDVSFGSQDAVHRAGELGEKKAPLKGNLSRITGVILKPLENNTIAIQPTRASSTLRSASARSTEIGAALERPGGGALRR